MPNIYVRIDGISGDSQDPARRAWFLADLIKGRKSTNSHLSAFKRHYDLAVLSSSSSRTFIALMDATNRELVAERGQFEWVVSDSEKLSVSFEDVVFVACRSQGEYCITTLEVSEINFDTSARVSFDPWNFTVPTYSGLAKYVTF